MLSNGFKLGASLFTVLVAAVLGVGITLLREDPIYAAVVAWALWAVGSPAGWDELRVCSSCFFFCDACRVVYFGEGCSFPQYNFTAAWENER